MPPGKYPRNPRQGRAAGRMPKLEQARKEGLIRATLAGISQKAAGEPYNLGVRQVQKILSDADRDGTMAAVLDQVKEELSRKLLPKLAAKYEAILEADAESLTKNAKGHQVQLTAARDLAKGLGVFTTKSETKTTSLTASMGLEEYMRLREERLRLTGPPPLVIDADPPE